jgi:hypothetical protein
MRYIGNAGDSRSLACADGREVLFQEDLGMSVASEIRMNLRCVRLGRWKMFRLMWRKWAYGLTHRTCRQCHGPKDVNLHANCYVCQWSNIKRALFDGDAD